MAQDDAEKEKSFVGKTLDRKYLLERQIGEGGQGQVYMAADAYSGRRVALKLLHPDVQAELKAEQERTVDDQELSTELDRSAERFSREVMTAQSICHPNLIQVLGYKEDSDLGPYYVMEYFQGETLKEMRAREGSLSKEQLLMIFGQIADGLAVLHKQGIIYRDLKAGNVYLVSIYRYTLVKLLDFGIALLPDASRLTLKGELVGTPRYMSPEQVIDPMNLTPRSDLYSFAILFYYMLTGQQLLQEKNLAKLFKLHMQNTKPMPHPKATPPIRKALSAMLLVDPSRRPSSIEEAWGELERALEKDWSAASLLR